VPDEPGSVHDWEEATYAKQALDTLCAAGYPSQLLCKTAGRCGDHYCSLAENADTCSEDCSGERNKAQDPQTIGGAAEPEQDAAASETGDAGVGGAIDKSRAPSSCSALAGTSTRSEGLALAIAGLALSLWRRRRAR
jgi:hypothetical protein